MNDAIERAIRAVGGPTKASFICRVSVNRIHAWRRNGAVPNAVAAFRLSRASDVPVEQLVGFDADGNGGDPPKGGKMSATYPDPRVARAAARQVTRRAETSVLRAA